MAAFHQLNASASRSHAINQSIQKESLGWVLHADGIQLGQGTHGSEGGTLRC